jgi:hypothetical protein
MSRSLVCRSSAFLPGVAISPSRQIRALHHVNVNGREFPVARLNPLDSFISWVKRNERFPEPIKGFNRVAKP